MVYAFPSWPCQSVYRRMCFSSAGSLQAMVIIKFRFNHEEHEGHEELHNIISFDAVYIFFEVLVVQFISLLLRKAIVCGNLIIRILIDHQITIENPESYILFSRSSCPSWWLLSLDLTIRQGSVVSPSVAGCTHCVPDRMTGKAKVTKSNDGLKNKSFDSFS